MFGIVQDITERKEAEQAAEASRHLLFDAIESMSQGFVLYDKDDRFVLANSHFKKMFPELTELMKPGMRYEEVLRAAHGAGVVDAKAQHYRVDGAMRDSLRVGEMLGARRLDEESCPRRLQRVGDALGRPHPP